MVIQRCISPIRLFSWLHISPKENSLHYMLILRIYTISSVLLMKTVTFC